MGFCPFWGVHWRATEADYWEKTRVPFNFGSQRKSSLGQPVIAIFQTVADIARQQYYKEFFVEFSPSSLLSSYAKVFALVIRVYKPSASFRLWQKQKNQLQDGRLGWWSAANEIWTKWENPIINVFPPNTELEILSQNLNLVWSGLKILFLEHEFGEQCNCFLIVREFCAL